MIRAVISNPSVSAIVFGLVLLTAPFAAANAGDWQAHEHGRRRPLDVGDPSAHPGFVQVAPEGSGITFVNTLDPGEAAANAIRIHGSGVAAGDVDGDGLCDLFFCGLQGDNALFRNLGNWEFRDVTAEAEVGCAGQWSTGAALADLDGDRDLDLLIASLDRGVRLFLNDGSGRFREATTDAGFGAHRGSHALAVADVDGDGDLDFYVANHRESTLIGTGQQPDFDIVDGARTLKPRDREQFEWRPDGTLRELGEVDRLYLNEGRGHFRVANWTDGTFMDVDGSALTTPPRERGVSVRFVHLNDDPHPDLFVGNDHDDPDRAWLNDGTGRFRAMAPLDMRTTSLFTAGTDAGDLDGDGDLDLMTADRRGSTPGRGRSSKVVATPVSEADPALGFRQQTSRNALHLNRGDGSFDEIGFLSQTAVAGACWAPVFVDVDLDGWMDLLVGTGAFFDRSPASMRDRAGSDGFSLAPGPGSTPSAIDRNHTAGLKASAPEPNRALRNRGDLVFVEAGWEWGFDGTDMARGICLADLDGDGDLDVAVNNLNASAGIFRNRGSGGRIAVRLRGEGSNTAAIGAMAWLRDGTGRVQTREAVVGGGYLSSSEPLFVFAAPAGADAGPVTLEVRWPDGVKAAFAGLEVDHEYEIFQGRGEPVIGPEAGSNRPLFEDATERLRHRHRESYFDDFNRQRLLPRKLSEAGPGVAWIDVDGDSRDDLVVGAGRGGRLGLVFNFPRGRLRPVTLGGALGPMIDDAAGLASSRAGDGNATLLVGQGNFESGDAVSSGVLIQQIWGGGVNSERGIPSIPSGTGPLAVADYDGDQDLDLFVAGRGLPGRYPEPASSRLFKFEDGEYVLDERSTRVLKDVGLVNGAIFSDLNGDGLPELVLACEWGPIRVFSNYQGRFTEYTDSLGFSGYTGWWTGVVAGDFNNDGLLDLAAANWGRNTPYESMRALPVEAYFGDMGGVSRVSIIEAAFDPVLDEMVPIRPFADLVRDLPWLSESDAGKNPDAMVLRDLLGNRLESLSRLTASWFELTVFLNRERDFEAVPLPVQAQFAPGFGICAADFNQDANEDLFIAQNFFGTPPGTEAYQSGLGLILLGDGAGGFTPMAAAESGIRIHGQQRGAAVGDYDRDGRIDLAVGQNGGVTRLIHNVGAKPGLRVRLVGTAGNPDVIGAVVQVGYENRSGPAREIRAGSGYLSQDSFVQVFGTPEPAALLAIRWPGGRDTISRIPPDAAEIEVNLAGQIKVLR